MAARTTTVVGKRGTLVIPAEIRERYRLAEGTLVLIEERPEGLTLRPAVALPVESYTPERKAELLLENAVGPADYRRARRAVRALGIDPDTIPHQRP